MRTQRRTRAALAALSVAAVAVTTACQAESSTQSGGKAPVVVWASGGADADLTKSFLDDVAKKNNITIDLKVIDSGNLNKQLPLALRTGQGPDVFSPNNLAALEDAGYLHPLGDVISEGTKKDLKTAYQSPSQFVHDGQLLAVPTNVGNIALVYNKDLFRKAGLDPEKPPTTFSEVQQDAKTITEKVEGAYGYGLPLKFNGVVNWMIDPLIVNATTNLTQEGLYNVDTHKFEFEKYQPVVSLMRTMQKQGTTYPGASSLDIDALRAAFGQGKIGMYVDQTAAGPELDVTLKSKVDWGIANTPVPDGQQLKQQIVHVGGAWAMNKNVKDLKDATTVLEALLSPEFATMKAKAGFDVPASAAAAQADLSGGASAHLPLFVVKSGGLQRPAPNFPSDDLNIKGDDWRAGVGKLLANDADPAAALSDLTAKYDEALQQAVSAKKLTLSDYGYPPAS